MLSYIWKYKRSLIFIKTLVSVIGAAYTFIDIYFIKWIFDALESKDSIIFLLIIIVVVGAIHVFVGFINSVYSNTVQPRMSLLVSEKINNEMISKAMQVDLSCYEDTQFFDIYTRALAETDTRVNAVLNTFAGIVSSILNVGVIISLISSIDVVFVIFGLVAAVSAFFHGIIINKISYAENVDKTPYIRKLDYVKRVIYQTEYAKEIKMNTQLTELLKEMFENGTKGACEFVNKYGKKRVVINSVFSIIQLLFENIFPWLLIVVRVFFGGITLGSAAAIFNATTQLPYSLNALFNVVPQMHQHSMYIENLRTILNYKSKIENCATKKSLPNEFKTISFDNVSFSYFKSVDLAINNLSMDIHKNKKIALVGTNGSGKSTLVKLLTRLYDPTEGYIRIDGYDIRQFDAQKYRELFGLCFQDYMVYAMTVAENILMRKVSCKDDVEKVERALKQVGLYNRIKKLPRYIDTVLTKEFDNDGLLLSGGELQKLVLARVFASDAKIIVLDEPSSSLDPISEYEINKTIFEKVNDKTVVLISHRLSTTVDADMIYYIESGTIIESGNHKELMERNKAYANLFTLQAENYIQGTKKE